MKIFRYFSILVSTLLLFYTNAFAMHRFYSSLFMHWDWKWLLVGLGIFLIFMISYSVTRISKEEKTDTPTNEETPYDIITRRYVKGEIDQKEFNNLMDIVKEIQNES
jgi:uncharacterized membrane protein